MKTLHLLSILAIGALTIIGQDATAQKNTTGAFEVGTTTLNIGIGLGRNPYGGGGPGFSYGTGFGVKAAIERGMWQIGPGVLSLGLETGGSFSNANYASDKYHRNILIIAARSAYHFGWNVPKLDTYGGVSAGPGFRSEGYSGNKVHDVVFAPGIFVGASYYFSPNIGVNVEAGYDITQIQGGIIFKLN
ncbi:MAG: outer membrane beta-barrel protein [Chitinophagaceae bacterium]